MDRAITICQHIISLGEFVKKTCAGRKLSHGYHHVLEVYGNAIYNYQTRHGRAVTDENINQYLKLATVAFLHDVADHKFTEKDPTLRPKMIEFIKVMHPYEWIVVVEMIDDISFSKENDLYKRGIIKGEPDSEEGNQYWINKYGVENADIRNTVSDEDKNLALGKKGLDRCIEYTIEKYSETNSEGILVSKLKEAVQKHADEKLFILRKFIRTPFGKNRADILHVELTNELSSFLNA